MSTIAFDLEQLYRRTFGNTPYKIPDAKSGSNKQLSDANGSTLKETYLEREVWLPTKFLNVNIDPTGRNHNDLLLPYSVIKISGKKTIVKTPMAERGGTVKELYSIDDYSISLKGFLIDHDGRLWPEAWLKALQQLFELQTAVQLDNALTNIFLVKKDAAQKVVIESLEFPEVEGGRKHVRPFNMQLESDSIFTLEVE